MACPKCGMDMTIAQRICPRCKFFPEENRTVSVAPPRAPKGSPPKVITGKALRKLKTLRPLRIHPALVYLAGAVVPGLGHVLLGHRRRGLNFALLTGALLFGGLLLFTGMIGRILYGIAVSVHAYSFFDLTPYRDRPSIVTRLVAMACILIPLMVFVYGPLLGMLGYSLFQVEQVSRWQAYRIGLSTVVTILFIAVLSLFAILATWKISKVIARRRGARNPR